MPACQDCKWRKGTLCQAHEQAKEELKRPIPQAPTGACTIAIVESYLPEIKAGMSVLEVGCGTWSKIIDHCKKVGAKYEGLDVQSEYYGIPCVATRLENLAQLSFADEQFDLIIGNQTMEHWGEHGCTPEWGLYQCFRVLKPGGRVFMNVPIHFHGTKDFVHGRKENLKKMFGNFSKTIEMESWGDPTNPLPPYYPHPRFWALKNHPAHVLDIRATKDKSLPNHISNCLGFTGKLAQIFHYSFSYNLYRLIEKVRHGSDTRAELQ
jgi:SAM-dependent methyltransferase